MVVDCKTKYGPLLRGSLVLNQEAGWHMAMYTVT